MIHSVRARVTLVATVVVAVVLVGAAFALVAAHRRALTSSLEETLAREAASIAADGRAGAPLRPAGDDDVVAQEIGADGAVVAAWGDVERRLT